MNLRKAMGWCVVWGGSVAATVGTLACNDAGTGPKSSTPAPVAEGIEHEACSPQGHQTQAFDARGDGKPVVTKVFDGAHELCRITDINHDGKPDLFEYFDSSGAVRRRESDYDGNGTIDSVEMYEGGQLVKREYDTTGQHRVDTWDYYDKASGRRIRRERDTNNDGRVDQWWTWAGDKITIAIDRNGDGKPDPEATLILDDKTGEMRDAKSSPTPDAPAAPSASAAPATTAAAAPPPPESPLDLAREKPATGGPK